MAEYHQNDRGEPRLCPAAKTNAISPLAVKANARFGMVSAYMPTIEIIDVAAVQH